MEHFKGRPTSITLSDLARMQCLEQLNDSFPAGYSVTVMVASAAKVHCEVLVPVREHATIVVTSSGRSTVMSKLM